MKTLSYFQNYHYQQQSLFPLTPFILITLYHTTKNQIYILHFLKHLYKQNNITLPNQSPKYLINNPSFIHYYNQYLKSLNNAQDSSLMFS